MIEKTFTAANEYSAPVFLPSGKQLVFSLSGTFVGTVAIQRLVNAAGNSTYPLHSDTGWNTVISYTAIVETKVDEGDSCWYRAKCTAYTSGSPAIKIKVA